LRSSACLYYIHRVNQPKDNAPRLRVDQIRPGERVRTVLLVLDKRSQTTKAGKPYLALVLGDRSGSVSARMWDDTERYEPLFEKQDFVFVDAFSETFNDQLQLRLSHLERVAPKAVDIRDFQAVSRFEPSEMVAALHELVRTRVRRDDVKRFLLAVLDEPDVRRGLLETPAAKGNHHAYVAGLVEHTLSMCRVASLLAEHYASYYPGLLDGDLLIAGAILHDIGKVWELSCGLSTDYTDVGRLVGHVVMGAELVTRLTASLGITDAELVLRLKHLVLSHHGELQYGAPVQPQTPEAQVLHYIDQIDARMNMFDAASSGVASGWTPFQRPLGRFVFVGAEADVAPPEPRLFPAPPPVVAPPRPVPAPTPAPAPVATADAVTVPLTEPVPVAPAPEPVPEPEPEVKAEPAPKAPRASRAKPKAAAAPAADRPAREERTPTATREDLDEIPAPDTPPPGYDLTLDLFG
jgi:3'-5' exoribonuclease